MSWFKRRPASQQKAAAELSESAVLDEPDENDQFEDEVFLCCMCGRMLGFDPEDSLDAEGPDRHLCGNCYRSREWDHIQAFEQGF